MLKNKFALKATTAAVGAVFAGGVGAAAVDLDSSSAVAIKYASEVSVSSSGSVLQAGAAADQRATVALGTTIGSSAERYVRLDLTGGKFQGNPSVIVGNSVITGTLESGGNGSATAVVKLAGGGSSASSTDTVTINTATTSGNGIKVTAQGDVKLRYRVFETATYAANATSGTALKDSGDVTYTTFAPSLSTSVASTPATADVSATSGPFTAFKTDSNTGVTTEANLGKVSVTDNGYAALDGSATSAATIMANSGLNLTGDFSSLVSISGSTSSYDTAALARLGLDTSVACAGSNNYDSATLSASTATFTGITPGNLVTGLYLCFTPNTKTAVASQTISGTLDLTGNTGYTVTDASVSTSITRNGAESVALLIPAKGESDTLALRINNIGSTAGKVMGTLYDADGNVVGTANSVLSSSLAARGTLTIQGTTDLAKLLGLTEVTWTKRAKLVIVAEIPSANLRVQNLLKSGGVQSNMSSAAQ